MSLTPKLLLRNVVLILMILNLTGFSTRQMGWSQEQLDKANTAQDIAGMTAMEKEAILYINLARMYPQQFINNELKAYNCPVGYATDYYQNSPYKKSLLKQLQTMPAIDALKIEEALNADARCFSKELGISGRRGHDRLSCPPRNYTAECVSYGMANGKDIAMQLLIDHNVKGEGHRKICLNNVYVKIGIGVHTHTKHTTCAVLEFARAN